MIRLQIENNAKVQEKLTELGATNVRIQDDSVVCTLDSERAFQTIRRLKEDPALQFTFFIDITGADWSKYSEPQPERFSVIYVLLSPLIGVRLEICVYLKEADPVTPSISSLFAGANWAEREVFDMYGIKFSGHPSLKRLLTPDDYEGYPLRKDYPLKGHGERASFPVYSATRGHDK